VARSTTTISLLVAAVAPLASLLMGAGAAFGQAPAPATPPPGRSFAPP